MINRSIGEQIVRISKKMPVISICGPRQSGKTTLAKQLFPEYKYINFEDMEMRNFAKSDPKLFLKSNSTPIILDEIQYVPELFSYIQLWVDESGKNGEFIITGSQNFLLLQSISQSLAGRAAIFTLLPLSINELSQHGVQLEDANNLIYSGLYPRLHNSNLTPNEWYPSYINTYIQRDVRQILNVTDLHTFELFLKVCAGRAGQIVNQNSLANEVGVSNKTIQRWFSVLEASYIIFFLQPYYKSYNKRIVKTPKLYFHDTGLLCSLLGVKNEIDIVRHFLYGSLFENLIISELIKTKHNSMLNVDFYFWKESNGSEIDCIIDLGNKLIALEIKSAHTIHGDFFKSLKHWKSLTNNSSANSYLIYGGDMEQFRSEATVLPWLKSFQILENVKSVQ